MLQSILNLLIFLKKQNQMKGWPLDNILVILVLKETQKCCVILLSLALLIY